MAKTTVSNDPYEFGGRNVADVGTTTAAGSSQQSGNEGRGTRRIRRSRGLPGGRAVVGALLVTAAAVAIFAAYLNATADPTTSYLVAIETIEPGTRFESFEDVSAAFGSVTVELTSPLDERAIPVSEIESLVGRVLVSPMQRGDLATRTALVDDGGVAPAQTMSFPISRTDAVGGTLRPGERVDVLATFGSGETAYTSYVVRGVPLLRITGPDGGPASGNSDLILTVAVTDLLSVQALGHAVNTAEVFVTRSSVGPDDEDPAPGAFRSEADETGPVPDPATSSSGLDEQDDEVVDEPGDEEPEQPEEEPEPDPDDGEADPDGADEPDPDEADEADEDQEDDGDEG